MALSRGCAGIVPSGSAGQPSSTSPEGVRRYPLASALNDPVEVIMNGVVEVIAPPEAPSAAMSVTGSIPAR